MDNNVLALSTPLPVIPLRDLVMFPDMVVPLFVGRDKSVKALEYAAAVTEGQVLLVAQKEAANDSPGVSDIYRVGVVSKILQVSKLQEPTLKVFLQGMTRVKILKFTKKDVLLATTAPFIDIEVDEEATNIVSLRRAVFEMFEAYVRLNKKINPDVLHTITSIKGISAFGDAVCSHMLLSVDKKQELLGMDSIPQKLEKILLHIDAERELLEAEHRIKARVKTQIEKNQKDYYLNEQLKAIHKELGDEDQKDETNSLEKKIKKLKMSKEAKEKALSELKKLRMMNSMSSEAAVIRNYLEWLTDLPWQEYSALNKDLKSAQGVLDTDHFGLEKVKERVVEFLAVNLRTDVLKSPILCFIGPPGVGKTSLAESIARATGRKFAKVSLGGLRDEAEIRGHRRTYIGAMPGKIIQAMKKVKTNNPVILLDEIDKLGSDHRGDPASALLEVLDPNQNKAFSDHYLEVDYDLSKVMFIATANTNNLPRPLLDRLEIIRLSGYTEDEKMSIAKGYLISKQQQAHAATPEEVSINDDAILSMIRYYTREAGVRQLDRDIAKVMRKCVKQFVVDDVKSISVSADNLKEFLGVKKYHYGSIADKNRIGIVNGLAYTDFGGDLLEIECVVLPGKGEVKITGKLGDVMKESIQAAVGFIRSRASEFGVDYNIFKDRDIHVHVPEGATPKDGPSAGVGMCIAIVSALTKIPVKRELAVTGEITLSGRVLAIGGLKEKLLSALRGGVKTVLIPQENVKDLEEIPQKVKDELEIISLVEAEDALKVALESNLVPLPIISQNPIPAEIAPKMH